MTALAPTQAHPFPAIPATQMPAQRACLVRYCTPLINAIQAVWQSISHFIVSCFFAMLRCCGFKRAALLLTPTQREHCVRYGAQEIAQRLQRERVYASEQTSRQLPGPFVYQHAELGAQHICRRPVGDVVDQIHIRELPLADLQVAIAHFQGHRPTMEDDCLLGFFNLPINGRIIRDGKLFGVFDGHGGDAAARFMRAHLMDELMFQLQAFNPVVLSDEGIWNALKMTFVRLSERFDEDPSGTTATVALMLDGKLWVANVGDARTLVVDAAGHVEQLSADAKPTDQRFERGVANRGGYVLFGRVNAVLGVARAIGDHEIAGVSARPKIVVTPIPSGAQIFLGCDGNFDVASTAQIGEALHAHRALPTGQLINNVVFSAFNAGSTDNISGMLIRMS